MKYEFCILFIMSMSSLLVEISPKTSFPTLTHRNIVLMGGNRATLSCSPHNALLLFARMFLRGGACNETNSINTECSAPSEDSDSLNRFMERGDGEEAFPELAAGTKPTSSSTPAWTDIPGPHSYSEESEDAETVCRYPRTPVHPTSKPHPLPAARQHHRRHPRRALR